jgi:hypothetical protein
MPPTPVPTPATVHGPSSCINIGIDEVRELDSTSTAIGAHTYDSFYLGSSLATTTFLPQCGSAGATLNPDSPCAVNSATVSVSYVTTQITLGSGFSSNGDVTVFNGVFQQDATIQFQSETVAVSAGDAVFHQTVDYDFCGTAGATGCGNRVGSAVEVTYVVEGTDASFVTLSADGKTLSGNAEIQAFGQFMASTSTTTGTTRTPRNIQVSVSRPFGNSLVTYRFTGPFDSARHASVVRRPSSGATTVISFVVLAIALLVVML